MKGHASFILILLLLLICSSAFAQQRNPQQRQVTEVPKAFQLINRDVSEGRISKENALLNKFYYVFDRKKLNPRYRREQMLSGNTASAPLKCFTPTIIEYKHLKTTLSKSTQQKLNGYLTTGISTDNRSYFSKSGNFEIFYTTIDSTGNAVPTTDSNNNGIPDYVEWAASYADSSYNCEVKDDGFVDPLKNGHKPYHIYIAGIPAYGYTTTDNNGGTYMVIDNNFASSNFPPNSDPDGKVKGDLKVTIAHEFKHAIQFATNQWNGESGKWLEMDATMMEDVVFDPVDDYYNYLTDYQSIFENPQLSMYPGSYYQVSWALYFYQTYGIQFWKKTWDDIGATNDSMVTAMSNVLQNSNVSFGRDFTQDELWHYASGARAYPGYGFKDKNNYPTPPVADNFTAVPNNFLSRYYLNPMSAEYERIVPDASDTGQVLVTYFYNSDKNGIGLLALNKSNVTSEVIYKPKVVGDGMVQIKTPWKWGDLSELGLVSTNASPTNGSSTRILIGANKIAYGDMDDNGTVNEADAYLILEYALGNELEYPDSKMIGDLSDNGTITPYDAALLLRHETGRLSYFSKDTNHDGFGPEYSGFQSPAQLGSSSNVSSVTYSTSTKRPVLAQNVPSISLTSVQANQQTDARIEIDLSNSTDTTFSSSYMEISFPSNVISNVTFDTTGSAWKNAIYKYSYSQGLLKLAIAEPDSFSSGILGYLNLTASTQSQATINMENAMMDEDTGVIPSASLSINIKPKTTVAIEQQHNTLPKAVKLDQNYPNPFNPTTIIKYELPNSSHVLLTVYDITGRLVETLQNNTFTAGMHTVSFDGLHLASGMYFYRLQVQEGNKSVVKMHKMLLIK